VSSESERARAIKTPKKLKHRSNREQSREHKTRENNSAKTEKRKIMSDQNPGSESLQNRSAQCLVLGLKGISGAERIAEKGGSGAKKERKEGSALILHDF
jgi:hypothetical protein